MIKHLLTIILVLTCVLCYPQSDKHSFGQLNDTIIWSPNYKLTYNDFKQKPDLRSKFKAISHLTYPLNYKAVGDSMYVFIFCFFDRSKSWFNRDSLTKGHDVILLSHEQCHFDISELETRKMRKRIIDAHLNKTNLASFAKKAHQETTLAIHRQDDLMDKETNFSIDKVKQKEWELRIKQQLKELEAYSNPIIKVLWKK